MIGQASPDQLLAIAVRDRDASDYRFRYSTYVGWCILTLGFYSYYGTYRLIERRVEHGKRRLLFSAALWHALAGRAEAAGRTSEVQDGLDNLSRIHSTLEDHERRNKRNPALLVLLRLSPGLLGQGANMFARFGSETGNPVAAAIVFLGWLAAAGVGTFINHTLSHDLRFLETWEDALFANAHWVARGIGIPTPLPARPAVHPKRETALYVLLTVVTFGIFAIVWRAMLMRDGNEHFDGDARNEDSLLWALGIQAPELAPPMVPQI